MSKLSREEKKKVEEKINNESVPIVIWIPKNTYKLKVTAKAGEHKFIMKLDEEDVEEARKKYHELDPDDMAFARFSINPLFLQFLEEYGDDYDLDDWEKYRREHE